MAPVSLGFYFFFETENEKKLTDRRGITVHGAIREIGYFSFYLQNLSLARQQEGMSF